MGLESRSIMRKKIALTIGCFDLLHHGHLNIFSKMAEVADELWIGVHDDESIFVNKKVRVAEPHAVRMKKVEELGYNVFPVNEADPSLALETVILELQKLDYDFFYLRGDDWLEFPGKAVIERYQIPIIIVPYTKGISSTLLRSQRNDYETRSDC